MLTFLNQEKAKYTHVRQGDVTDEIFPVIGFARDDCVDDCVESQVNCVLAR